MVKKANHVRTSNYLYQHYNDNNNNKREVLNWRLLNHDENVTKLMSISIFKTSSLSVSLMALKTQNIICFL